MTCQFKVHTWKIQSVLFRISRTECHKFHSWKSTVNVKPFSKVPLLISLPESSIKKYQKDITCPNFTYRFGHTPGYFKRLFRKQLHFSIFSKPQTLKPPPTFRVGVWPCPRFCHLRSPYEPPVAWAPPPTWARPQPRPPRWVPALQRCPWKRPGSSAWPLLVF